MIYEDYPGKGAMIAWALFSIGIPAIAWWVWIAAPLAEMTPCDLETIFAPAGISFLLLSILWMMRGNFAIAWGPPQPKYSPWAAEILGVDAYGNPCKYYNTPKKKKKSKRKGACTYCGRKLHKGLTVCPGCGDKWLTP